MGWINPSRALRLFNTGNIYTVYIDFDIFTLYFIVVFCKNFGFVLTNYKRLLWLTLKECSGQYPVLI